MFEKPGLIPAPTSPGALEASIFLKKPNASYLAVGGSVSIDSSIPVARTLPSTRYLGGAFKGEHTMKSGGGWARLSMAHGAGVVCMVVALSGSAQVHTQTTTTTGKATAAGEG